MKDEWFTAADGRRIHFADFDGDPSRAPLICLPGLTRNHRDFLPLTDRIAGERRIICPEMRGRGKSDFAKDPDAEYQPHVELADVIGVVDSLGLGRVAVLGTSRGGIQAMIWAMIDAPRLAAAGLVDIGPVVEKAGLEAIVKALSSRKAAFTDYESAGAALERAQKARFPDVDAAGWTALARRILAPDESGRLIPDYDPELVRVSAAAFENGIPPFWEAFDALAGIPVLSLRGANSDLFSAETQAEMARRHPGMAVAVAPDRGHCPFLDEPESISAIDELLARADANLVPA